MKHPNFFQIARPLLFITFQKENFEWRNKVAISRLAAADTLIELNLFK